MATCHLILRLDYESRVHPIVLEVFMCGEASPTQRSRDCLAAGPSETGDTYEIAKARLLELLKRSHGWTWAAEELLKKEREFAFGIKE